MSQKDPPQNKDDHLKCSVALALFFHFIGYTGFTMISNRAHFLQDAAQITYPFFEDGHVDHEVDDSREHEDNQQSIFHLGVVFLLNTEYRMDFVVHE